jgi:hypothetical protein
MYTNLMLLNNILRRRRRRIILCAHSASVAGISTIYLYHQSRIKMQF